jgi:hypothetical protein
LPGKLRGGILKTTRTNETQCLNCKTIIDAATHLREDVPEPGSLSICSTCGDIAKYNEELKLIPLTNSDWVELKKNQALWEEIVFIQGALFPTTAETGRG